MDGQIWIAQLHTAVKFPAEEGSADVTSKDENGEMALDMAAVSADETQWWWETEALERWRRTTVDCQSRANVNDDRWCLIAFHTFVCSICMLLFFTNVKRYYT